MTRVGGLDRRGYEGSQIALRSIFGLAAILARIGSCLAFPTMDLQKAFQAGGGVSQSGAETGGQRRNLLKASTGFLGSEFDVQERWHCNTTWDCANEERESHESHDSRDSRDSRRRRRRKDDHVPPPWDSSLCMLHWGLPHLQEEVDPSGYLIFVHGREDLTPDMQLLTDGLVIAKSLNRTLVEFPMKDSSIGGANDTLGMGSYLDLLHFCGWHRMIDIHAFRSLVARGLLNANDFVTIGNPEGKDHPGKQFRTSKSVKRYFWKYIKYKVIVMEGVTRGGIKRDLSSYVQPNPFFIGVVRMIMESEQDWARGNFLAVDWEAAESSGNLTICFEAIMERIEERRLSAGLGKHQVLFVTDLYRKKRRHFVPLEDNGEHLVVRRIQEEYPRALRNELYSHLERIEDAGVRALVAGLTVASARVMISTSLSEPGATELPEANVCQSPSSGKARLMARWRSKVFKKKPETLVSMFFFEVPPTPSAARSSDLLLVTVLVSVLVIVWYRYMRPRRRRPPAADAYGVVSP